jgi:hypothetical protein
MSLVYQMMPLYIRGDYTRNMNENLLNVSKRTDPDIKPGSQNNKCLHSSTKLEMTLLLPTFRNNKGIERLNGLERYFYAFTTDTPI